MHHPDSGLADGLGNDSRRGNVAGFEIAVARGRHDTGEMHHDIEAAKHRCQGGELVRPPDRQVVVAARREARHHVLTDEAARTGDADAQAHCSDFW